MKLHKREGLCCTLCCPLRVGFHENRFSSTCGSISVEVVKFLVQAVKI
jgi:hypothetical protein